MNRHPSAEALWHSLRNPECTECELHRGCNTVCALGDGPIRCKAMIVGEAPGSGEDNTGIPFSGKAGQFLRGELLAIGLDPAEIFICNAVACRPPGNRTPSRKEIKTCVSLFLWPQIELVRPSVVLLLGNTAISAITGKKATVTKMEGSTFTLNGIHYVPCRHPSSVIRREGEQDYPYIANKFRENLHLFKKILYPQKDTFKFSTGFPDLQPGPVYVDIETNGLNPFRPNSKLWCISIAQGGK